MAPVAAAIRPAAARPASESAAPVRNNRQGAPDCSSSASAAMRSSGTAEGGTGAGAASTGTPPGSQAASPGTIRLAIRPGALRAAAIAAAAAWPTSGAVRALRTQSENGRATASTSVSSGECRPWWWVAWSPMTLTTGERARRALCRLARPLARPGPRCSSVTAGLPAIRA